MNTRQKKVLWVVVIVLCLMILFPPYHNYGTPAGYGFIFLGKASLFDWGYDYVNHRSVYLGLKLTFDDRLYQLDYGRLGLQCLLVLLPGAAAFITSRGASR